MLSSMSYGRRSGSAIPIKVPYIEVLLNDLSLAMEADHLFVSMLNADKHEASTLYYLTQQRRLDNFIYSLDDSPCAHLFEAASQQCEVYQDSYKKYPFSNFPCTNDIKTYMGVPILDQHGLVVGILVAMFYQAIGEDALYSTLMKNTAQLLTAKMESYNAFETTDEHPAESQLGQCLLEVTDKFDDTILLLNQEAVIEKANKAVTQVLGYGTEEIQGMHLCELFSGAESALHMSCIQQFLAAKDGQTTDISRQLVLTKRSGKELQVEIKLCRIAFKGTRVFLLMMKDITERVEASKTIYRMAYYDAITQIKNRNCFEHDIRSLLKVASDKKAYIYCALLDIDQLAKLNLNFGIEGGNYCIRFVARRLQQLLTSEFQVYKSGIDSFFILYRTCFGYANPDSFSRHITEKNLISPQHFALKIKQQPAFLSISLGSAVFKAQNYSYETLVNTLEFAKSEAKKQAPFGHFFMGQGTQLSYKRSNNIRSKLYSAIQKDEFYLLLQPQYTKEQHIGASEALLRWQSEELGLVFPDEFIPIAEQSGAIIELGFWVIDKVCQIISQCAREGIKARVAVNISGKQIMHTDFKTELLKILKKWKVQPELLILELTETTLVEEIEQVKALMLELNAIGFKLSIDDFGTGYSSLSYLKALPISELKIDRYFVKDISDENINSGQSIIQLIINMARILKVKTVAEGVETELQYDYLQSINCDMYQGYLFTKPMPVSEWRALLTSNANLALLSVD